MVKNIIFALSIVLFANISSADSLPHPKEWLTKSIPDFKSAQELPETRYAEVQITMLIPAVRELKEKSFIQLTDADAKYYAGPFFKTEKGLSPFLVRGLFANYTGEFSVYWNNGDLLVSHFSLGGSFSPEFCPLIVNLPVGPKNVYVEVGGAR